MRVSIHRLRAFVSGLVLFGAGVQAAQAVVLDFNSVPVAQAGTSPIYGLGSQVVEDGFRLSTRGGVSFTMSGGNIYALTPNHPYWTGSPAVYSDIGSPQYGSAFLLEKVDGGLFDLTSMDVAAFSTSAQGRAFSVYGRTANNTTSVFQVSLDTSLNTLQTLTFGSAFTNLRNVIFSSVYAQVDNIQVHFAGEVAPTVPQGPAGHLSAATGRPT